MKIDKAKIRLSTISKLDQNKSNTRPSVFTERHRGEFYNISIDKLIPFKKQPRQYFDANLLQKMAETITLHGIRQPLTVISTEDDTGKYEIVSGERRYRAAIIAGLHNVPCIILHDRKAAAEISLIENIQRKDLHPVELAKAYQQLLDEEICSSKTQIAEKLGLPKSTITETMQLLNLPISVRNKLLTENITNRDLFRKLLDVKNPDQALNSIEEYSNLVKLEVKTKHSGKLKRKILLKVILYNNQISIDTNAISTITMVERNQLKQQLLDILQ